MRKPSFALVPEGGAAIGFCAFSGIFFAILDCWIPALLFWLLTLFSLNFFRDPQRVGPHEPDVAASPADGRIAAIAMRPNPFGEGESLRVSVFMNVFNVHVNRAPVACKVKNIRYIPGKFLNASLDKASEDNERCQWLLEDDAGRQWAMTQIAGLIARRIVCWAEIGDALSRGQRLGMIRFGSRVDLYLPQGYVPAVKQGDKVYAGETIIARKA